MNKETRYSRVTEQLKDLLVQTRDPVARMATMAALLHHKLDGFFWTGFYLLREGELIVGPYQGPLACQVLEKHRGVCWASIDGNNPVIVPDVHKFPGHITCDSRSRSEIAIPVRGSVNKVLAVLDVDSKIPDHFDQADASALERMVAMVYA